MIQLWQRTTVPIRDDTATTNLFLIFVALRWPELLIIEMKPRYDEDDRRKLLTLLSDRRADLFSAMRKFALDHSVPELRQPERLIITPGLAFGVGPSYPRDPAFTYFLVRSFDEVQIVPADATGNAGPHEGKIA